MRKVYRSKIDVWLLVLVYGLTILSISPSLYADFSWLVLVLLMITFVFITILLFGIKYVIKDRQLYVHYACFYTEVVEINRINKIFSTKTLLSAPAASLDRICIEYDNNMIVISPRNKEDFIHSLCERCEHDIIVEV